MERTFNNSVVVNPKWVRGRNGYIAGVCDGLGQSFGVEPWVVRTLWLVSVLFFGFGVFLYFVLAVSLPKENALDQALAPRILGVCSALSIRFNIEVGLVRFLTVMLAFSSFGITLIAYFVLYLTLPGLRESGSTGTNRRYFSNGGRQ